MNRPITRLIAVAATAAAASLAAAQQWDYDHDFTATDPSPASDRWDYDHTFGQPAYWRDDGDWQALEDTEWWSDGGDWEDNGDDDDRYDPRQVRWDPRDNQLHYQDEFDWEYEYTFNERGREDDPRVIERRDEAFQRDTREPGYIEVDPPADTQRRDRRRAADDDRDRIVIDPPANLRQPEAAFNGRSEDWRDLVWVDDDELRVDGDELRDEDDVRAENLRPREWYEMFDDEPDYDNRGWYEIEGTDRPTPYD